MADRITGVHRILPTYPIKPSQPADKDRDDDQGRRRADDEPDESRRDDEPGDEPSIDEYV